MSMVLIIPESTSDIEFEGAVDTTPKQCAEDTEHLYGSARRREHRRRSQNWPSIGDMTDRAEHDSSHSNL